MRNEDEKVRPAPDARDPIRRARTRARGNQEPRGKLAERVASASPHSRSRARLSSQLPAMPRSAGNPNMSSKVDASGTSSMGDVHQWFKKGDTSWGQRKGAAEEMSEGALSIAGLGPEVSEQQVRDFFGRFYSTVSNVRLTRDASGKSKGSGTVTFRFAGERDKAVSELSGRELGGHTLNLSKLSARATETNSLLGQQTRPGQSGGAAAGRDMTDEEIHKALLRREALRANRDFNGADLLAKELRARGVLLDTRALTWRASDGRTGQIPSRPLGHGGRAQQQGGPLSAADAARTLRVQLDESFGTNMIKRILGPYNVEEVSGTRDGWANLTFADAASAATALSVAHYSPTGGKITLVSYEQHAASAAAAAAPHAGASGGGKPALNAGWT